MSTGTTPALSTIRNVLALEPRNVQALQLREKVQTLENHVKTFEAARQKKEWGLRDWHWINVCRRSRVKVVISPPNGDFGESSWNSRERTGMPPISLPSNDPFFHHLQTSFSQFFFFQFQRCPSIKLELPGCTIIARPRALPQRQITSGTSARDFRIAIRSGTRTRPKTQETCQRRGEAKRRGELGFQDRETTRCIGEIHRVPGRALLFISSPWHLFFVWLMQPIIIAYRRIRRGRKRWSDQGDFAV